MYEDNTDKKYKPFQIPGRQQFQKKETPTESSKANAEGQLSLFDAPFCEIEYEIDYTASPIQGVGKFIPKAQKIAPVEKNEIRELFYRMRDIEHHYQFPTSNYSKFYDKRIQQNKARIFYEQALFMKDFEDDYEEQVPFSSYFPYYQMLSYEQLRTYFTWRTNVRRGVVNPTSLSYAYLYLYELLNNIGVENPQEGLKQLLFFWQAFRNYDSSIDKYVVKWIKDYHIYYPLPQSLKDFAEENSLMAFYPDLINSEDSFELFCSLSKYDIHKSTFLTAENQTLITDCFQFMLHNIRQDVEAAGLHLDNFLFCPVKKMLPWTPFKDALFYHCYQQPDKKVVLSEKEIYLCTNNSWTYSTVLTTDAGKRFTGYLMKQMEAVLRQLTNYKYKLSANVDMIAPELRQQLCLAGIPIEQLVERSVRTFYREATKTVVVVDDAALARIREEALKTQEALIVEEAERLAEVPVPPASLPIELPLVATEDTPSPSTEDDSAFGFALTSSWQALKDALSVTELQALSVILRGENLKQFADDSHMMLEVLADGINEKAMDFIGDNILDEEFCIYADYTAQVAEMEET